MRSSPSSIIRLNFTNSFQRIKRTSDIIVHFLDAVTKISTDCNCTGYIKEFDCFELEYSVMAESSHSKAGLMNQAPTEKKGPEKKGLSPFLVPFSFS
jgi:hypothetical protein